MTDQSNMQKMHNTPGAESNVQNMHIPQEWVEAGARAAAAANNDDPDFLGYQQGKPNWQLWSPCIEAALAAVIPLVREDERKRIKASGHVIVPRDVRQWWAYPIEMPINAENGGPAEIGVDAVGLRFEVWDRELNTIGDFEFLPDAINRAMIAASEEGE